MIHLGLLLLLLVFTGFYFRAIILDQSGHYPWEPIRQAKYQLTFWGLVLINTISGCIYFLN